MLFEYRGWHFAGSKMMSGPNFGGTEFWSEVKYTKGDRICLGTGHDEETATQRAYKSIDWYEDEADKPIVLREVQVVDGEIPF